MLMSVFHIIKDFRDFPRAANRNKVHKKKTIKKTCCYFLILYNIGVI